MTKNAPTLGLRCTISCNETTARNLDRKQGVHVAALTAARKTGREHYRCYCVTPRFLDLKVFAVVGQPNEEEFLDFLPAYR